MIETICIFCLGVCIGSAQAKEENKLFDFTAGKARNSIILLKNGNVVVSTASSNDIVVALKE